MNKSIATEKEKMIKEWEIKYSHDRIHSFSKDVHVADVINHLSQSLDHIASVARQEGREEAIEPSIPIPFWVKIKDSGWHHMSITNEKGMINLYIDGKLCQSGKEEKV